MDTLLTSRLQKTGTVVLRYGLVLIIGYFGAFKFTAAEAKAIQPLLEHSPLMSWLYGFTDGEAPRDSSASPSSRSLR
jgi:uncharacterized membrane protein YkgB